MLSITNSITNRQNLGPEFKHLLPFCVKKGLILTALLLVASLLPAPLVSAKQDSTAEKQAVILMYHQFGVEKYPSTNIRIHQFESQLDYLSEQGFLIWPLSKVVKYIQEDKEFPGRVVSITIDDAYSSVYTEAYPRLAKRNWPFTVFVATDGVDKGYRSYMSWGQIRELQKQGVTFANHSASHDYLIRFGKNENLSQWKDRITQDIQRAQNRLITELGKAPMLFAYPYGEYNTELAKIVESLGYTAFGQHSGPARTGGDTLAIPRFPMAEKFAALTEFKLKVNSLAFPILEQKPWEPTLTAENNPPQLEITLENSDARLSQLSCFVSNQGQPDIKWINQERKTFSIQANSPLPVGRSRYNCTAPSHQPGRYYWYSHLWINPLLENIKKN